MRMIPWFMTPWVTVRILPALMAYISGAAFAVVHRNKTLVTVPSLAADAEAPRCSRFWRVEVFSVGPRTPARGGYVLSVRGAESRGPNRGGPRPRTDSQESLIGGRCDLSREKRTSAKGGKVQTRTPGQGQPAWDDSWGGHTPASASPAGPCGASLVSLNYSLAKPCDSERCRHGSANRTRHHGTRGGPQ